MDVVLAAACRTPVGKFNGSLRDVGAVELGAIAVREAVARAGLSPADVDEVVMGNVLQAGLGQNPARQAALKAGLPETVSAYTVNKVCGSSLKAVMLAAASVRAGDASIVVAGGMESMTNAPYLLRHARGGYRLGDGILVDGMIYDGLLDAYNGFHMGRTGEIVAQRFQISREEADRFALESHRRAQAASEGGDFKEEVVPVPLPGGGTLTRDEGIRSDTTLERLARLKPVFKEDGIVTAGNASQISDGGAAVVVASREAAEDRGLPVLARVRGSNTAGVRPDLVMEAPIYGARSLLDRLDLGIDDIDQFEHNEAFATASCAVRQELRVPPDRFNPYGGAVALGHPLGASGARILTTLVHALHRKNKRRGLVTLCLGGGNAVSMVVER
ncbi:MAG TPA: thiolase family protein [Candidatus Thermoplasmatota archaeon]|nr:thiolase family protein [Candidatus Thermoplasmatota archaeon]